MFPHVYEQAAFMAERLPALFATKRLLAGVGSLVNNVLRAVIVLQAADLARIS